MNNKNFLIKLCNSCKTNLIYVYNKDFLKKLQKLFTLFNNTKVININFLDSREEVDQLLGQVTPNWLRGVTIDDNVYILTYNINSYMNTDEFYQILIHELVHALINRKIKNCPLWLNEGIALILSDQYKYMNLKKFSNLKFDMLSYEDDFFYEKCCAKTMHYFNQYSYREFIDNLIKTNCKCLTN